MFPLKPRAIAVLVALRSGPRTTSSLRSAIGDRTQRETMDLLIDMIEMQLVEVPHNAAGDVIDDRWYLDHNGLGWLQSNGLNAAAESRAWEQPSYKIGR